MIIIIGTPSNILADISVDISFILTRVSVKQFEILICIFQRHLDLLLISRVVSPVKYWVIFQKCVLWVQSLKIYIVTSNISTCSMLFISRFTSELQYQELKYQEKSKKVTAIKNCYSFHVQHNPCINRLKITLYNKYNVRTIK